MLIPVSVSILELHAIRCAQAPQVSNVAPIVMPSSAAPETVAATPPVTNEPPSSTPVATLTPWWNEQVKPPLDSRTAVDRSGSADSGRPELLP